MPAGESESQRRIRLTVVKASQLRKRYLVGPPNCYAAVSVDSGPVKETRCLRSANPEWNDSSFELHVQESSTINIQIFHRTAFSNRPDLLGEAELSCRELPVRNTDGESHMLQLQKHGSSKSGSLVVRCDTMETVWNTGLPHSPGKEALSSNDPSFGAAPVDSMKLPLRNEVVSILRESHDCVHKNVAAMNNTNLAVNNATFNSVGGNQYNITNNMNAYPEAEETKLVESLPGIGLVDVCCDEDSVCLENTRLSLLDDTKRWMADLDGQRVFWLHGVAGSGKSTVANTVAAQVKKLGYLGVSFRFNRDVDGRNVPSFLFGNLAYQLAHFHREYRTQLLRALQLHGKMKHHSLRKQLKQFIVDVLAQVGQSDTVIIVIDALDECGVESERQELLEAMAKELLNLPRFVKVLVTSRDERDIRAKLKPCSWSKSINEVEGTSDDILAYIDDRMRDVVAWHPHLEDDWPGSVRKNKLRNRADGLFIWIAVAYQYIRASADPNVALDLMLSGHSFHRRRRGPEAALDELYLGILQRTPAVVDAPDATKYVVGSILVLNTPLARTALDSLLGLSEGVTRCPVVLGDGSRIKLTTSASLIGALGSILRTDDNGVVRVLHASIIDFFTSRQRCTDDDFFIDKPKHNRELARCCFQTMLSTLKRDICEINDPTKFNCDISYLKERLEKKVPAHLRYACEFWHRHLADVADEDSKMYHHAKEFLFTHLLHWIEVMSLLCKTSNVFTVLRDVKSWFQRQSQANSDCVLELIDDALRFMQEFHDPIRQSAAHIYVSSIPFTLPSTLLFKTFAPTLEAIPRLSSGIQKPACLTIYYSEQRLVQAAFAADGSWFVYVQDDKTLHVWDLATCSPIGVPLVGHESLVHSIEISYDGTYICSADYGGCVWVWDTRTYMAFGPPFQRLDGNICPCQIGFSGDHIVALYQDDQVFIWDIVTRTVVANYKLDLGPYSKPTWSQLLLGAYVENQYRQYPETLSRIIDMTTGSDITDRYALGDSIADIAVSRDNSTIACRYSSSSIRIFKVQTGNVIGDTIIDSPTAMQFSKNGRRLICDTCIYDVDTGKPLAHIDVSMAYLWQTDVELSIDDTYLVSHDSSGIQVLDVPTGNIVALLRGRYLNSKIAISPNKTHVVCCQHTSIIVWDLALLVSRQANNHQVESVTPSPTSQHLLIAFSDKTLQLSDATASPSSNTVLKDAKAPAAFSPDGSRFVTASTNYTLRVWDSNEAIEAGIPLQGHQKAITAVAFSSSGSRIVSASDDLTIRIWDISFGMDRPQQLFVFASYSHPIQSISLPDELTCVCVSEHGVFQTISAETGFRLDNLSRFNHWGLARVPRDSNEMLCMSHDGQHRLFDSQTGRFIKDSLWHNTEGTIQIISVPNSEHVLSISNASITRIAASNSTNLSPNARLPHSFEGKWMVTVAEEMELTWRILLWDLQSKRCIWDTLEYGAIPMLAFSCRGNCIAIVITQSIQVRTTLTGILVSKGTLRESLESFAFSPDEKRITCVTGSKKIITWDVESGTEVGPDLHTDIGMSGRWNVEANDGNATELKPGREYENTGSDILDYWTLTLSHVDNSKRRVLFEGHSSTGIQLPTFSSNGCQFASVLLETVVHVWDISTETTTSKALKHSKPIMSLAFSPDGSQILSVSGNIIPNSLNSMTITQIWDITSGLPVTRHDSNGYDCLVSAAFFPDGHQIVTISRNAIQIWDLALSSASPLGAIEGDYFNGCLFSPNGSQMFVHTDFHCQLWDITEHKLVTEQHCRTFGDLLVIFSPDSRYIAFTQSSYPDRRANVVRILDAITGAICKCHPIYYCYQTDITSISFSSDSTRLFALFLDGTLQVINLRNLPDTATIQITSSYSQDHMLITQYSAESDGWFRSEHGEPLLWLPTGMRRLWLATGGQSRRLFRKLNVLGGLAGFALL